MVLSDEELRRRLHEHSIPVPPITESTRGVLLKKLQQLDASEEVELSGLDGSTRKKSSSRGRRTPLFDYSSAEDEPEVYGKGKPSHHEQIQTEKEGKKRRDSVNGRRLSRKKTPNGLSHGHSHESPLSRPHHVLSSENSFPRRESEKVKSLLSHSEEEEEEDDSLEEEEEEDVEEEEESEEEEDSEEEEERGGKASSSPSSPSYIHHRRIPSSNSSLSGGSHHRFASSTPLSSLRSTASYLEGGSHNHHQHHHQHSSSSHTSSHVHPRKPSSEFSPLSSSTLRKQIASNKESFGEALSSLPQGSTTTALPSSTSRLYSNGGSSSATSSSLPTAPPPGGGGSILTQAPHHANIIQKEFQSKRSSICNSASISKIIIFLAGIFFSGIAFKYSHLRPNPNIMSRILICEESASSLHCVSAEEAEAFISLHKESVSILEKKGVETLCGHFDTQQGSELSSFGVSNFSYPVEELFIQVQSSLQERRLDKSLFTRFIDLLHQNPQWGLLVNEDQSYISLYNPPIDWSCWLSLKIGLTYSLLLSLISWSCRLVILFGVAYGCHRWRLWYTERKLRENQDVFELVEHVLSILATQNTLVLREGRSSSPCIAINHIRDQLISPQDRDKKRKLWEKVVHYIRKSESRVREGTQKIYGEDVEVWQWIPDIRWGNSSLNHHGPNPYVPGVAATTSNSPPPPSPPPSHPSPQWQGSAFSSLNKNVAAPSIAPTTCLKVRHMFDRTLIGNSPPNRWVWQVKEEILRRCSGSATILHIAVDKQSSEGCVYIKTSNTDGAGAVFRCLHGQWYRGNLVTVKYLREERYLARFPDSRLARTPLLPQSVN